MPAKENMLPLSHRARLPRLTTGTIKDSMLTFCPVSPWQARDHK